MVVTISSPRKSCPWKLKFLKGLTITWVCRSLCIQMSKLLLCSVTPLSLSSPRAGEAAAEAAISPSYPGDLTHVQTSGSELFLPVPLAAMAVLPLGRAGGAPPTTNRREKAGLPCEPLSRNAGKKRIHSEPAPIFSAFHSCDWNNGIFIMTSPRRPGEGKRAGKIHTLLSQQETRPKRPVLWPGGRTSMLSHTQMLFFKTQEWQAALALQRLLGLLRVRPELRGLPAVRSQPGADHLRSHQPDPDRPPLLLHLIAPPFRATPPRCKPGPRTCSLDSTPPSSRAFIKSFHHELSSRLFRRVPPLFSGLLRRLAPLLLSAGRPAALRRSSFSALLPRYVSSFA